MQTIKYIHINEGNTLPDISQYAPFKVLLSVDNAVNSQRQQDIANWLVQMGGMHVTVRAKEGSVWKSAIRKANLAKVNLDAMQPEQFVMVTMHPHVSLRNAFKLIKKHAWHTHVDLDFTVLVHVAEESSEMEYVSIFSRL